MMIDILCEVVFFTKLLFFQEIGKFALFLLVVLYNPLFLSLSIAKSRTHPPSLQCG